MRNLKSFLRSSLTALISVGFLLYIFVNRSELINIYKDALVVYIIPMVFFQICVQFVNGMMLRAATRPLDVSLGIFESFKVTTTSSFVNFITPVVGGVSSKGLYLKNKHGVNLHSFASLVYGTYLVAFLTSFTFGILGLYVLSGFNTEALFNQPFIFFFFFTGSISCILFMFWGHQLTGVLLRYNPKKQFEIKIVNTLKKIDTSWEKIRGNKEVLIQLIFWSILASLSTFSVYFFAMKSLNITANIGSLLLFTSLSTLSLLLNLTPGNIGIREAVYTGFQRITDIATKSVIAFSLLERTTLLLITGTCWLIFSPKILKENKKKV